MISSIEFIARRTLLCRKMEKGIILLFGSTESPINYNGNVYPFRQESTFLYLIGIALPSLAAIIDAETGNTILFGNNSSEDDIIWQGQME